MKFKLFLLGACLMCLATTGCSNTRTGVKDDVYDAFHLDRKVVKPPQSGVYGVVLKEPNIDKSLYSQNSTSQRLYSLSNAQQSQYSPPQPVVSQSSSMSPQQIHGNMQQASPVPLAKTVMPVPIYKRGGVSYNSGSVTVFPLDGIAPVPRLSQGYPYRINNPKEYFIDDGLAPISSYSEPLKLPKKVLKISMKNDKNAIYFKHGSASLGASDKNRIKELAKQLKTTRGIARITGYASQPVYTTNNPLQKDIINLHMGIRRATAVTEELYRAGVGASQIETMSQGNANTSGDAKEDRRVDIQY